MGPTMIFFTLFLVSICKFFVLVESSYVEGFAPAGVADQVFYPYHPDEGYTAVEVELKSESGKTAYKVKCIVYPQEDTKVDIYNTEGLRLETLFLDNVDGPCEEKKLQNYILPGDKLEDGAYEIMYLWSDKKPRCVEREYRYHDSELAARVWRYGSERKPCPKKTKEFFESFTGGKKAGGVVELSPTGKIEEMEYTPHVSEIKITHTMEFETKDLKEKHFRLICQKGTVKKTEGASGHEQVTALLVHEDYPTMYLDKFKLKSCKTTYINVNRQIFNGYNDMKVVFQYTNGKCFEREYDIFAESSSFFYNKAMIYRKLETQVKCPKAYVGDIDLNAQQPWYKTFFLFSFLFSKPEAYGRVVYPVVD